MVIDAGVVPYMVPLLNSTEVKVQVCWIAESLIMGRMHDADVSASLRLKLTYDGLAHYVGMQNDVLALVRVLRLVVT